eukprot:GEZU01003514.1.p1 GENE.GEZU01003514.1~~GEZU01003514.1.p1  ORF type:complete len:136 (-),score=34.42 GEZU01003514.1:218-625(-)
MPSRSVILVFFFCLLFLGNFLSSVVGEPVATHQINKNDREAQVLGDVAIALDALLMLEQQRQQATARSYPSRSELYNDGASTMGLNEDNGNGDSLANFSSSDEEDTRILSTLSELTESLAKYKHASTILKKKVVH